MNTPLFKFLPLSWRFLFSLYLRFMLAVPVRASPVDCSKGTLVTVVAHLDGDLLFVEPAISEPLCMGWCVTTVHLIGGANGGNFAYLQKREEALRLAGVGNTWEDNATSTGRLPSHIEAHSIGFLEHRRRAARLSRVALQHLNSLAIFREFRWSTPETLPHMHVHCFKRCTCLARIARWTAIRCATRREAI